MSIYIFGTVMIKSNLTGRRNQDTERKRKVTFRKGVHFMKKVKFLAVALALTVAMAIPSFAAWVNFSGGLPEYQGDTEISTVSRQNPSNVNPSFGISIDTLGDGFTAVRAWTESRILAVNFSSPYNQVLVGNTNTFRYTREVAQGTQVTLNLDNPVYISKEVAVIGDWTPN